MIFMIKMMIKKSKNFKNHGKIIENHWLLKITVHQTLRLLQKQSHLVKDALRIHFKPKL